MWYILSICIGAACTYLFLRKKIIKTQEIDEKIKQENNRLLELKEELSWETTEIQEGLIKLSSQKTDILQEINDLNEKIIHTRVEAEHNKDKVLKQMSDELSKAAELESEKFQNTIDNYEQDFLLFQKEITDQTKELISNLNDLKSKTAAAVEANKRIQQEKDKELFYKINLSAEDKEEIAKLKEVSAHLKVKEPLNKVIWKFYYEKPFTDLVGRVLGANQVTGIYKITNLNNNKCYVGQAVDVANRWKTHIKKGMGAEPMTNNKLYPAMMENGVENFSFELIEKCSRNKLNEREQFWQDYFKAKEFGYSIK